MARYTKITTGHMGQLVEWPEVLTEGKTLEECRVMLKDATHEMILAYHDLGKPLPPGSDLIREAIDLREDVALAAFADNRIITFDRNTALSHEDTWE